MKTYFPKKKSHKPKYFILDAKNKLLGRVATEASLLLRGKYTSLYTPSTDQGNFVLIINAEQVLVSGKKESQKLYFRNSQRPGSLKKESLSSLRARLPVRILEKSIYRMLPKGVLGKTYFRRLFIYSGHKDKGSVLMNMFQHNSY